MIQVGNIGVAAVVDGTSTPPLEEIVVLDGTKTWDCPDHPLDQHGRLVLDLGAYLIRTKDRLVLVDAGVGSVKKDGFRTGGLPESLRRLDVDFGAITDVAFTHLHWDHVGWATQRGEVVFPNATYRVHQADWEHFVSGPDALPGAAKKLLPVESQLELFDSEQEFAPGVIARPAPGHTPGSTVYVIADGGERAVLLGDVVHTIAELTDPEWKSMYDLDPIGARKVRDRIASEFTNTGDVVAAAHFPDLQFGRLIATEDGRLYSRLS